MAKVLILTESFPFPIGDDYLTDEIDYWAAGGDEVVLAPARIRPKPHPLPAGVSVELDIALLRGRGRDLWYALRAVLSNYFRADLVRLWHRRRLRPGPILASVRTIARTLRAKRGIDAIIDRRGVFDLAYAFWFDAESFAAALCKQEGQVRRLVCRAHGFDVYAHRRPGGFFPVKEDVIPQFDRIYAVSNDAATYLNQHYHLAPDVVRTSRLGVKVPDQPCPAAGEGCLYILSIAYCVGLKRIDKLIDALGELAPRHPDTSFVWAHVGDGPRFQELREQANLRLGPHDNVVFSLIGGLGKTEIQALLARGPFDLFVNTSDTEGLPVSIMEAMSYGIPSIAPQVGGIAEIVRPGTGWLLPSHPGVGAIAEMIEHGMESAKSATRRAAARSSIIEVFDAVANYERFVRECRALASGGSDST